MDRQQADAQPASKMAGFTAPKAPVATSEAEAPPCVGGTVDTLASFLKEGLGAEPKVEEASAEEAEKTLSEAPESNEPKDAAEAYRFRLRDNDITLDAALRTIDALALEGKFTEIHALTPKVKIKISTRSTRFNSYLADKVDIADPKKVGKLNQLMSEYQVAASLDSYGTQTFPELNDDMAQDVWEQALERRLNLVRRLPSPIFLAIVNKIARFDAKMIYIFSEGYEKNF